MTDFYRPFANGFQFADWVDRNCSNCEKSMPPHDGSTEQPLPTCAIEHDLWCSYDGAGSVCEETARRMGFLRGDYEASLEYGWPCTEIQPTSAKVQQAVDRWKEKYADTFPETPLPAASSAVECERTQVAQPAYGDPRRVA